MDQRGHTQQVLAAFNAHWQRYARARDQHLDTIPLDALRQEYLLAQEALAAVGLVETMLVYDRLSMTFSLPADHDQRATAADGTQPDPPLPAESEA